MSNGIVCVLQHKTATIVGVLFLIGWVAGVLAATLAGPLLNTPDYLIRVAANGNQITLGACLMLVMGFALVMVPVMMYPIFKKQNEILALGYVVFRVLEAVTYIVIVISWLLLLSLSREYMKAGDPAASFIQTLGNSIRKAGDLSQVNTMLVFGLGALIFYYLLYRSRLIPRWLSGWGFVGAALHLALGLFVMFDLTSAFSVVGLVMSLPIGLNELVLASWLIVKGFDGSAIGSGYVRTATDP